MEYQRINKSSSWNPPIQKKSSQFTPRPFSVQRKQGQPTQQDIENEVFSQNKFEAFGLQLKEKNGTITPVEQERLGVLQAKMDEFWAQRREQASARPSILDKMAANIQRREITQPSVTIQPKLTIGQPNDQYEQEADQVAAQVVEQINTQASNKSQGASVQRQEMTEEEVAQMKPEISTLQRKDISSADEVQTKLDTVMVQREGVEGGALSADLEGEINDSRGGGQSLAPNLQAQMGQAMGADFSGVRVHTDTRADRLNRSVGARAFTTGQDLFFKQGEYQPGSRGGQELIAHELTHVVQQNGGAVMQMPAEGHKTKPGGKIVQTRHNSGNSIKLGAVVQLAREKIAAFPPEGINNDFLINAIEPINEQIAQIESEEETNGFINREKLDRWHNQYSEKIKTLRLKNGNNVAYSLEEIKTCSNDIQEAMRSVIISLGNMRGELNKSFECLTNWKDSQLELDQAKQTSSTKPKKGKNEEPKKTPTQQGPIGLGTKWKKHRENLEKLSKSKKTRFIQYVPKDSTTIDKALKSQNITDAVYHEGKAFWVSLEGTYELSSSSGKVKMIYTFTQQGAKSLMEDYLICGSGDYADDNEEEWKGESQHPDYTIWKTDEIGAYGIGSNRLQQLASYCTSIKAEY